jgi:hypothetical protein
MKKCDICGKEEVYLYGIDKEYAEPGMKDICEDCERTIRRAKYNISRIMEKEVEKEKTSWAKRFLARMKTKQEPK